MNDIFLKSITAGGYHKSLAIDTEYLSKERPWSIGKYGVDKTFNQVANISYNTGQKLLTVYVSLTIGGEPITQLTNGNLELFKVSAVNKASLGIKNTAVPTDGIFVFTYENTTVAAGDILFVDFSAYDPFTDTYLRQRTSVSGV